jgi:hypothetical protein
MFSKAQENDLICGLVPNLIPRRVVILQYADDSILMFKDDFDMAINVKIWLYLFESMSSLKINFDKSELMLIVEDSNKLEEYTKVFNCQMGFWPIKYLVLQLVVEDWK